MVAVISDDGSYAEDEDGVEDHAQHEESSGATNSKYYAAPSTNDADAKDEERSSCSRSIWKG